VRVNVCVAGLIACLVTVLSTPAANATFPGANGEIAYIRYSPRGGGVTLRTIQPDGAPVRLLATRGLPIDADWTSDGSSVALLLSRKGSVVLQVAATGVRTPVVTVEDIPGAVAIQSVAISPAGDAVVLCVIDAARFGPSLYTVDVDGSNLVRVSDHADCYADWGVGDRIVATNGRDSERPRRIVTMDPDGSNRQAAVVAPILGTGIFVAPSWAPDGSLITYAARYSEHRYDLYVVAGDGNEWHRLTNTPARSEYAPVYSPDGARIAFAQTRLRLFARTAGVDLFSLSVDGGDRRQLTDTPDRNELTRSWQPV
jgi:Tol biopolymer transport system component